ncbi:12406_t:CDS:2, partial [Cetraspora pellucida]
EPPHPRTVKLCTDNCIHIEHTARKIRANDFDEFDYIFCMDDMNLREVKRMMKSTKNSKAIVKLFGEYDPQGQITIDDPYYSGEEAYRNIFVQITRCSEAFLQSLEL